jgi:hypothetical protein
VAERFRVRHDRWFWLMRRRAGAAPEPTWPAGVRVRAFDGSDAMLADWNKAYNDSFADNYRFVPSRSRVRVVKKPGFRADGLMLAYRGGEVAGFCRNELFAARGEIARSAPRPRRAVSASVARCSAGGGLARARVSACRDAARGRRQRWRVEPLSLRGLEVVRRRHLWAQPVAHG